jgi:aminopeptidase YwaD
VPAGNSWGVPVAAGRTTNVVALPTDFDSTRRHLIVGAHLDTVPQAPGAEDNASGTSVMLELARVAATERTRLPVVFVAFGAEEPRGVGDDWHHFGSQEYVAQMSNAERRNLVAMVSFDRVGVGSVVPVCGGGLRDDRVVRALNRAARQANIATDSCGVNQSSDHWSFERAGLPAARLGSTAYDQYHREDDLPRVVQPKQLKRVGELAWEFIAEQG